ncbi:hypothetical protein BKA65DRAFT_513512 [Rhexocercosporidium sp. MPI-PUGE-AT-0058]|nr:hypothetical protein BKA65DRAFT_513512 [Rhexocercosporidium sp. MPI-PUGE-AT-0058]
MQNFDTDMLKYDSSTIHDPMHPGPIPYHYFGSRLGDSYEEITNPTPRGMDKWFEPTKRSEACGDGDYFWGGPCHHLQYGEFGTWWVSSLGRVPAMAASRAELKLDRFGSPRICFWPSRTSPTGSKSMLLSFLN